MSVVRCPKGHFYDDQRFSQCPHCGISAGSSGKESCLEANKRRPDAGGTGMDGKTQGMTSEKKRGLFGWLDREKTSAFSSDKAVALFPPLSPVMEGAGDEGGSEGPPAIRLRRYASSTEFCPPVFFAMTIRF